MTYHVVALKLCTGDVAYIVDTYSNRGHAIARYRGLERRSWAARSEMAYGIRTEKTRRIE